MLCVGNCRYGVKLNRFRVGEDGESGFRLKSFFVGLRVFMFFTML